MKRLLYLFTALCLMALPAAMLSSCGASEEDDLFPESAAQRLNHGVEGLRQQLIDSPNGWVIQYLPYNGNIGGTNIAAKFTDKDVTMSTDMEFSNSSTNEVWPVGTELTSGYSVKSEQGVILSFDTYNLFLHNWTEPKGSSNPYGYQGDYEFVYLYASENGDTLHLRGKKHGNDIVMYKLKDTDAKSFIQHSSDIRDLFTNLRLDTIQIDSEKYGMSSDGFIVSIKDTIHADTTYSATFFPTETGFMLAKPVTVNGTELQYFTYDEQNGRLKSDDNNATIQIPSYIDQFLSPKYGYDWTFTSGQMDEETQNAYNTMVSMAVAPMNFDGVFIGADDEEHANNKTNYQIVFQATFDLYKFFFATYKYGIDLQFDSDASTVRLTGLGESEESAQLSAYCYPLVERILNNSPYNITFNDGFVKRKIKFVSQKDPNMWFSLSIQLSQATVIVNYI